MTARIKNSIFVVMALMMVVTTVSCGKYKGFKKDESGFYYKMHIVNDTATSVEEGTLVLLDYSIRTQDSLLVKSNTTLMISEEHECYKGDLIYAIRKLHLGDSATFIFEADSFAYYYLNGEFPFDDKEIYMDVKLVDLLTAEELTELEEEYNKGMKMMSLADDSSRTAYLTEHKITTPPSPSGLIYKQTKAGKGKQAEPGKFVTVNYTGKLLNGTTFDSSEGRDPFVFILGAGQVIPGWDEGIALMKEGEKGILIIPPHLGYGERDGGIIPPFSTLVFDVELVSVMDDMPAK